MAGFWDTIVSGADSLATTYTAYDKAQTANKVSEMTAQAKIDSAKAELAYANSAAAQSPPEQNLGDARQSFPTDRGDNPATILPQGASLSGMDWTTLGLMGIALYFLLKK